MRRSSAVGLLTAAVAMCGCGDGDTAVPTAPALGQVFNFSAVDPPSAVRPQIAYTAGVADTSNGTAIAIVDLISTRRRVVARLPGAHDETSGFTNPAWSPDGKHLAFAASQIRTRRGPGAPHRQWVNSTWVMAAGGGGRRRLPGSTFVSATAGTSFAPIWTPDARAVITRGRRGLALLPVNAQRRSVSTGVAHVAYSPDARRVLLEAPGGLWAAQLPDRRLRRIVADGGQASWSPDSRHVVFVTNRDHHGDVGQGSDLPPAEGGADEIYIADANGRNQRRVTDTTLSEMLPRWSPDGRLIVFDGTSGGEILSEHSGALAAIRPDGRCQTTLPLPTSADLVPGANYDWRPGSDTSRISLHCP